MRPAVTRWAAKTGDMTFNQDNLDGVAINFFGTHITYG